MKFLRRPPRSSDTPAHPAAKRQCIESLEQEADVEITEEEYESAVLLMKEEMKKKKKNSKELCKLMEDTYQRRQQWIQSEQPPVQEILEVYPALKQNKVVSKH